jgi:calcineurin B family protein 1
VCKAAKNVLCRFSSLDKQEKGYLTREDFLRIPELAINPLGDRIVHSFFTKSQVETMLGSFFG